jgi:hypothetical protein
MGWTAEVQFLARHDFSLHHNNQAVFFTHPASYPMVTGALFSGVKQLGCEANHSPPSSANVKNLWSYTSTPPYVCIEWCLGKHNRQLHLHPLTLPVKLSFPTVSFKKIFSPYLYTEISKKSFMWYFGN